MSIGPHPTGELNMTSLAAIMGDLASWGEGADEAAAHTAAYTLLTALTIGLNSFVVCAVVHTRRLHTMSNALLMAVAAGGLLLGLAGLPVIAAGRGAVDGPRPCSAHGALLVAVAAARQYVVVALAVDKYRTLAYPVQHEKAMRWRLLAACCCGACALGCALATLPLLQFPHVAYVYRPDRGYCGVQLGRGELRWYGGALVTVLFLVPAGVLCFCYGQIFHLTRSHSKRIGDILTMVTRNAQCPLTPQPAPRHSLLSARGNRASWTIVFFLVSFLLTNAPLCLLLILETLGGPRLPPLFADVASFVFFSGSALDPLLYGVRMRVLRESFASFLRTLFTSNTLPPGLFPVPVHPMLLVPVMEQVMAAQHHHLSLPAPPHHALGALFLFKSYSKEWQGPDGMAE